jgi:manganese/zinc/iron transport system substrate-binding protein
MNDSPRSTPSTAPRRASRAPGAGAALVLFLVPLLPLPAVAQAAPDAPGPHAPIEIVATVGMIGDVAEAVAGACARVTSLMGPGTDPHLYRASAGDVQALQRADVILYGGLGLEGRLAEVLESFAARKPTVAVSEAAVPEALRLAGQNGYAVDPHVWMDASLWTGVADVVAAALAAVPGVDPACAAQAAERASAYRAQLEALHDWAAAAVASVPEERRVLVTAHDAFHYFGRAYDVAVVGIQGVSTESEAAVADIRRVAEVVVTRGVPAVFVESTINPRTVQAVVEAVRQRGASVTLGEALYADAMGASGTPDGTYIGMLVHNVRAIVTALGGSAPDLPTALAPWLERFEMTEAGGAP